MKYEAAVNEANQRAELTNLVWHVIQINNSYEAVSENWFAAGNRKKNFKTLYNTDECEVDREHFDK